MSDCLDENSALELLDGRLASAVRARIEQHIEACEACRELVVELTRAGDRDAPIHTERSRTICTSIAQAGPYRVEYEVGSGAAGTVFRAVDARSGAVVALKYVTDPGWRSRFSREVETLSRLVHPGIVRYIGHGETANGMYLAMEWLDGEDLARCLSRGRLQWPSVRVLGLRLTAALAHAHAIGAVHRDLSPRNVFLPGSRVEHAKLLDFGLVHVHDTLERTGSQAVLGTPYYMAPEQVKDPRNVDPRSDLFSLGVIFFEALSGARPFYADDLFTVWLKIVDQPPPDLRALVPGLPEALVALIERLLAKDPAERPASAAEVHQILVHLDHVGSTSTGHVGPVATAVAPPRRPPSFGPHAPYSPRPAGGASQSMSHGPPNVPSPRRGSGVFAVAAGVGVTALLAASTIVVALPRVLRRSTSDGSGEAKSAGVGSSSPSQNSVTTDDDTDDPDDTLANQNLPAPTLAQPSSSPTILHNAGSQVAKPTTERLFCGGENHELQRGGNYQPDPDLEQLEPVRVSGACKATLEDCVIGGRRSISVLGHGELTLRRCRVMGETRLVGDVALMLEGTTLPSPPIIVGKARVVRR